MAGKNASGGSELEQLARRVRELEDIEAIRQLKYHYWACLDRLMLEDVRACFLHDATIDMEGVPPVDGPDDFVAFVERAGKADGNFNIHSGQNPRITITGPNNAEGKWDQIFFSAMAPKAAAWGLAESHTIRLTGEYNDRYVRTSDGWRIAEMRFRQTSFVMSRIDENGAPQIISMGRSDGSAFGE